MIQKVKMINEKNNNICYMTQNSDDWGTCHSKGTLGHRNGKYRLATVTVAFFMLAPPWCVLERNQVSKRCPISSHTVCNEHLPVF